MGEPRKPKPTHVQTVCDVCGLDWKRHGKAPTTEKCIELLKADLAKVNTRAWQQINGSGSSVDVTYFGNSAKPNMVIASGIGLDPETKIGKAH